MKKKGLLIANAFLRTDKFLEHYRWLQKAAAKHFVELELMDNASRLSLCGEDLSWLDSVSFVLFWDKDIRLGKEITRCADARGIPVFNSIDAIAACDDKFETYHRIACYNEKHSEEAVSILPTILAPMTYENIGYMNLDFLSQVEEKISYPMIVKECFGSFGMQVYLAESRQELERLTGELAGKPFLYQKYHQYSRGRDVRLQVVGGQVVAAMYRYSENGDFRANITNGGKMTAYEASEQEKALAVKVAKILGLDFAGVDLLFAEECQEEETERRGELKQQEDLDLRSAGRQNRKDVGRERRENALVLCEVNSNAHFKNIYTCTGVNVADCIMDYVLAKTGF